MDLRKNKITLGELMDNTQAAEILKKEFPEWADSPLIKMASGMTISKVLKVAGKHVPKEKLAEVITKLEQL